MSDQKKWFWLLLLLFLLSAGVAQGMQRGTLPDSRLLQSAYSGNERLFFQITWLGVPAGTLDMQVDRVEDGQFRITVVARSIGLLAVFYPVEDRFITWVEGRTRFPVRHEMDQREGSRVNRKVTVYDQQSFRIIHRKNDNPPEEYQLEGPAHNEFSSFFIMRALRFDNGERVVVPTFADKKRHEVEVMRQGLEEVETVMGPKEALLVRPHLAFKGLYSKVGDPLVWLTDDEARIPVRIQAKIVIGSLTATLVDYSGPSGSWRQEPPSGQANENQH